MIGRTLSHFRILAKLGEGGVGVVYRAEDTRLRGPGDFFSPVEHVWHLVDLEREGFNRRISRLLMEDNPLLPDFDGDAIVGQRNYRARSLREGLAAFAVARRANITALRTVRRPTPGRAAARRKGSAASRWARCQDSCGSTTRVTSHRSRSGNGTPGWRGAGLKKGASADEAAGIGGGRH